MMKSSCGRVFLAIGVFFLFQSLLIAEEEDFIKIQTKKGIIALAKPVDVIRADMFSDGGTTGVILADKNKQEFSFCLDGRMTSITREDIGYQEGDSPEEEAKKTDAYIASQPPQRIYINAPHPGIPEAEEIPPGGEVEKTLIKILEDWLERNTDAVPKKEVTFEMLAQELGPEFKQLMESMNEKQKQDFLKQYNEIDNSTKRHVLDLTDILRKRQRA